MEIYYLNSDEFLKTYNHACLKEYADRINFKSEKRFIQHALGRFLLKSAAKKFYSLDNSEIIINNNKPQFANSGIKFSISHSGKFIMVVFDNAECGIDIEEIKPRNIKALSTRYEKNFRTLEDFYIFWTEYEAEIKLQQKTQGRYSCVFQNNYMLTVVSENPISSPPSCINFLDV